MMKLSNTNQAFEQHATVCVHCDHIHGEEEICCSSIEERSPTRENDSLIGQVLGEKYLIEEKIGAGGMCQVYRATQTMIGKTVALKVLRPQLAVDQQLVRRFEQEASALGRLCHPHAINVFDFGFTEQDAPYLVMDFISGHTLNEVIRQEGPLPVVRTNRLLGQICGALQAAHAEGIIHRDIKPENILISEADGEDWATVVDFGVAKIQEDINHKVSLTGEGIIIGTPRYMSPEQSEGNPIDTRSDIYSLGVVLYEMLAGEAPFTDNSSTRLLIKHISELPPPLRQRRPDLSEEIEALVMSTLAKDPNARPASALELSKAFEQAAAGLLEATPLPRAITQVVVPLSGESRKELEQQDTLAEATQLRTSEQRQTAPAGSVPIRGRTWFSRQPGKALSLCALALVLVLGFLYYSRRTAAVHPLEQVAETQRTISLAVSQISLLPQGHLLRDQLPELFKWQTELGGYATLATLAPATQTRVQTMERLAKQYAEQARLALEQPTSATSSLGLRGVGGVGKDGAPAPGVVEGEKSAENAKQAETAKGEAARPSGTERRKGQRREKGPNKFTRAIKKVFRAPFQ
jgi:serine/threonine protein kinase